MNKVYLIKDITSRIIIPERDRIVDYVKEQGFPIVSKTRAEAKQEIAKLEKGYYLIEEVCQIT